MNNKILNGIKVLAGCVGLFLICLFLGIFALYLAYGIKPNVNYEEAGLILEKEGAYPSALGQYNNLFYHQFDDNYAVLDGGTDNLIIQTASEMPSENRLYQMMSNMGYPRYWHGYLFPVKIILHFMGLEDWRALNFFIQLSLVIFTAFLIYKRTGKYRYVLALLSSYYLLMPMAVAESLQYSPVFYITFIWIAFFAGIKKKSSYSMVIYLFLLLGIATSYFDLLTFPLLTWALPLLWFIALSYESDPENNEVKTLFLKAVGSGIAWLSGYALFWASKWVIASKVLGYDVKKEAIDQLFLRAGDITDDLEYIFYSFGRYDNIYLNWKHYENYSYNAIILGWIIFGVLISVAFGYKSKFKGRILYALIGLSGVVWYVVVTNHTTIHHFFTYRIYNICITAFILYICSFEYDKLRKINAKTMWKNAFPIITVWLCAFVISFVISGLTKDKAVRQDIGMYTEYAISDGDIVTFDYVPYLDNLKELGICFWNYEGSGQGSISFLKDGETIYSYNPDMSAHMAKGLIEERVDLHLTEGDHYTVRMEFSGINSVTIDLADETDFDSQDFGEAYINGENTGRHLINSMVYRGRIKDGIRRLVLSLEMMGLIGWVMLEFLGFIKAVLERQKLKK